LVSFYLVCGEATPHKVIFKNMRNLYLLLFLTSFTVAHSQSLFIKGQVTNELNKPLALVKLKWGTDAFSVTNQEGKFEITTKDTSALNITFSLQGYVSQTLSLRPNTTPATIQLLPEASERKEIVIIGYGEAKKQKHNRSHRQNKRR